MATKPVTQQAMLDAMKTQQQGCSELRETTNQPMSNQTSSKPSSRRTEVMSAVLKHLVPAMTVYFPMFASRFGTDEQSIGLAMSEYAERLDHHGVTGIQFKMGIAKLKTAAGETDFFPNPERFALMCKSAANDHLPTLDAVTAEIKQRRGPERHNADFKFSHELTRLINQRKGNLVYELTSMQFEKTIKAEYEHWCKRIADGEQLPEPLKVIDHKPAMPEDLKAVEISPAVAKRIAAIRSKRKG